ncbi:NUDIX hydrolase [Phaeobacter sp. B1627]|uniref:NUDIX hydrolase n=1 Tax=Phaeobacter sp. B1627 TaxID=2583809 RepID=UPI0021078405|nr:NUDIX hydrolase [Phaeobacter sp. B1627]
MVDGCGQGKDAVRLYHQVGALCFRLSRKGRIKVLLVTSRRTGRWVIPKGWPMVGKTDAEAAAQEAWEEAGAQGRVSDSSIGHFSYHKIRPGEKSLMCRVEVFPLRVRTLADRYPERRMREREWMSPGQASKHVAEPELAALLKVFRPQDL